MKIFKKPKSENLWKVTISVQETFEGENIHIKDLKKSQVFELINKVKVAMGNSSLLGLEDYEENIILNGRFITSVMWEEQ